MRFDIRTFLSDTYNVLWGYRWGWQKVVIVIFLIAVFLVSQHYFLLGYRKWESNDDNCALCHKMQDHLAHYKRFTTPWNPPNDLSTEHRKHQMNCIHCHGEPTALDRWKTLYLGTNHLVRYMGGWYEQPSRDVVHVPDRVCRKCHELTDYIGEKTLSYHGQTKHNKLEQPIPCYSCHPIHEPGRVSNTFQSWMLKYCRRCHPDLDG